MELNDYFEFHKISSKRINSQIQTTAKQNENGVAVSGVSEACFRCVSLETIRLETKFHDLQAYGQSLYPDLLLISLFFVSVLF